MNVFGYKKLEDLTLTDLELLRQVYNRLVNEGYEPGFSFEDFFDIVIGRGEHKFNEFREQDILEKEIAR